MFKSSTKNGREGRAVHDAADQAGLWKSASAVRGFWAGIPASAHKSRKFRQCLPELVASLGVARVTPPPLSLSARVVISGCVERNSIPFANNML